MGGSGVASIGMGDGVWRGESRGRVQQMMRSWQVRRRLWVGQGRRRLMEGGRRREGGRLLRVGGANATALLPAKARSWQGLKGVS